MDKELERLVEEAREWVLTASASERSTMYACQAFGWTIAELMLSITEDGADRQQVKRDLEAIQRAVQGDATVYLTAPDLAQHAWRLASHHREYVLKQIESALAEI